MLVHHEPNALSVVRSVSTVSIPEKDSFAYTFRCLIVVRINIKDI